MYYSYNVLSNLYLGQIVLPDDNNTIITNLHNWRGSQYKTLTSQETIKTYLESQGLLHYSRFRQFRQWPLPKLPEI
jgi:hypothetical protein